LAHDRIALWQVKLTDDQIVTGVQLSVGGSNRRWITDTPVT